MRSRREKAEEKAVPPCRIAPIRPPPRCIFDSGHQVIAAYDNGAAVGSPSREYIRRRNAARQDRQRRDGLLPPRPSLDARDHRLERQRRQPAGALPLRRKLVPKRRDAQLDAPQTRSPRISSSPRISGTSRAATITPWRASSSADWAASRRPTRSPATPPIPSRSIATPTQRTTPSTCLTRKASTFASQGVGWRGRTICGPS